MLLGIFFCWYIAQCINYGGIVSIDFRIVYSIIICHISFYLYKGKEFFLYYDIVIVFLAVLSLVVWLSALVMHDVVYSLFATISVWDNGSTTYGNAIVVALGNQHTLGILRNIGFTWEAGRFACFIVVGLFCNLMLNNLTIKRNKSFAILFITLFSTLSTTGIIAALMVDLYIIRTINRKK